MRLEQVERLALVLVERVALGVAAQVDALAQMVEVEQVLLPQMVEDLQEQALLGHRASARLAVGRRLAPPSARRWPRAAARGSPASAMPSSLAQSATGRSRLRMRRDLGRAGCSMSHCSA